VIARLRGWLWIVSVLAAIVAVQVLDKAGYLARVDDLLNSARFLVPAAIALAVLGAVLVAAAMIHGLATDATHRQVPLTLDDRVGGDTTVEPGKVSVSYRGRTTVAGEWVLGYFRGTLLWGASFYEESSMAELKRSWRSGEWLHVRRYLRATVAMSGFLLLLVGALGAAALLTDVTAVRLLLLLVVAYALVRTAYAFSRA
jgi:hypothetical protein